MGKLGGFIVSFIDFFFNTERVWTLIASGIIGMTTYAINNPDATDFEANKWYWIALGLPTWLIIRFLYWKIRLLILPNVDTRWRNFKEHGYY